MKKSISKVFKIIVLLLVIVYSLRNVCLNMFGSTTTGFITNTTQRHYNSEESDGKVYKNTSSYYFMLDGKKYEGYVSYQTDMPIVRAQDQKIREATVQYLEFFPYANTLKEYNDDSAISYIMWYGLILVCLFGIFKRNKVKKKTNKKAPKPKTADVIQKEHNIKTNTNINNNWICSCGAKNDEEYCKICGNAKSRER